MCLIHIHNHNYLTLYSKGTFTSIISDVFVDRIWTLCIELCRRLKWAYLMYFFQRKMVSHKPKLGFPFVHYFKPFWFLYKPYGIAVLKTHTLCGKQRYKTWHVPVLPRDRISDLLVHNSSALTLSYQGFLTISIAKYQRRVNETFWLPINLLNLPKKPFCFFANPKINYSS